MKRIYKCDICRDEIEASELYGVVFSDLKKFTLGGYGSTDGVHICKGCAKQLKEHLNSTPITKELQELTP